MCSQLQADEINVIVGNAFRTAYTQQENMTTKMNTDNYTKMTSSNMHNLTDTFNDNLNTINNHKQPASTISSNGSSNTYEPVPDMNGRNSVETNHSPSSSSQVHNS
jgi:hypothetical protein